MQFRNAIMLFLLAAAVPAFSRSSGESVEKISPGVWPNMVFRWSYNPRNHPAWMTDESARAMVIEAARQWEICGIRMEYQGETALEPGKMDRSNVVGWSLAIPKQLRGITLGQARNGQLFERDIAFRPDRKEFEHHPHLLQKVITHEFGHAIGLTHSARCNDVMTLAADCPGLDPEELPLTLTAHDLERCRKLYNSK